jgi:hypothetical protein
MVGPGWIPDDRGGPTAWKPRCDTRPSRQPYIEYDNPATASFTTSATL